MGWAIVHAVKRHSVKPEEVAILELNVSRSWLKRWMKGRKHTGGKDILPDRIRRVLSIQGVDV